MKPLPEPKNRYGYPYSQLKEIFTESELEAFGKFMHGQTWAWDETTNEGVAFPRDVEKFTHSIREVNRGRR